MHNLSAAARVSNWKNRKYRRFDLECPVRLMFQSDGSVIEVETTSENVSICGLLVRSASIIPQQTHVTFTMTIPVEEAVHPIHLGGQGQIVRVESSRVGASFAIAINCETPITQLEECLPVG